jgi:leucine-zipper of insertion element IS481
MTLRLNPCKARLDAMKANAIMRETGKSKTCVWRWRERFAAEGVDGLVRDKTRPSRIPQLDPLIAARVVAPGRSDALDWRGDGRGGWRQRRLGPAHPARLWARAPSGPTSS